MPTCRMYLPLHLICTYPHTRLLCSLQGGSIVYPRIKTGDDVAAWCKQVVAECGVLLLPASVYDHAPTAERGHLRIGLGRKDLPECLKQLDEWCVRKYGEPSA